MARAASVKEVLLPANATAPAGANTKAVRIAVISDTHNTHETLIIPPCDILVHCGDFTHKTDWKYSADGKSIIFPKTLVAFNAWLGTLKQCRTIIVISGNHEIGFNYLTREAIHKQHLNNATHYLQDNGVTVDGISFYGTPWTNSSGMAFSISTRDAVAKWAAIPVGTAVVVSHLPPLNILDRAWVGGGTTGVCPLCNTEHPQYSHWGNSALRKTVTERVKPVVHLFGHVHDDPGAAFADGVTFINAATHIRRRTFVFDYAVPLPPDAADAKSKPKAASAVATTASATVPTDSKTPPASSAAAPSAAAAAAAPAKPGIVAPSFAAAPSATTQSAAGLAPNTLTKMPAK